MDGGCNTLLVERKEKEGRPARGVREGLPQQRKEGRCNREKESVCACVTTTSGEFAYKAWRSAGFVNIVLVNWLEGKLRRESQIKQQKNEKI